VGEQRVHSRRPGTGRTANRVAYPHSPADIPALKPLLGDDDLDLFHVGQYREMTSDVATGLSRATAPPGKAPWRRLNLT
jgi:hypothetical protein